MRPALVALASGIVLILVACGSAGTTPSAGGNAPPSRPRTDATLHITAPGPNSTTGRNVDVVVALQHARVVQPSEGVELRGDRGHLHLTVDGTLVAMPTRLRARVPALAPGSHTISVEFVASDHLPFSNRVVAAVTFTAR